mmetsp:Transcript_99982/g.214172  ORF Transcript_99982/g.214172 Transcript_99982/m.214172 type:complete len:845 (-) Transcript_99982:74-2608(-)
MRQPWPGPVHTVALLTLAAALLAAAAKAEADRDSASPRCLLQQGSHHGSSLWIEATDSDPMVESLESSPVAAANVEFYDMGQGSCVLLDGATPAHEERQGDCRELCARSAECKGFTAGSTGACALFYEGPLQAGPGGGFGDTHCHALRTPGEGEDGATQPISLESTAEVSSGVVAAYRDELAAVREELAVARSTSASSKLQERLDSMQTELASTQSELVKVREEANRSNRTVVTLQGALHTAESEANTLRGDLEKTKAAAEKSELTVSNLRAQLTEEAQEVKTSHDEVAPLRSKLVAAQELLAKSSGSSAEAQEKLFQLKRAAEAWRSEATKLKSELGGATNVTAALRQKLSAVEEAVTKAEGGSRELREKLVEMKQAAEAWRDRAGELKSKLLEGMGTAAKKVQEGDADVITTAAPEGMRKRLFERKLAETKRVAGAWHDQADKLEAALQESKAAADSERAESLALRRRFKAMVTTAKKWRGRFLALQSKLRVDKAEVGAATESLPTPAPAVLPSPVLAVAPSPAEAVVDDVAFFDTGEGTCLLLDGALPAHRVHHGRASECGALCTASAECKGYSADAVSCVVFYEGPVHAGGASTGRPGVHCHKLAGLVEGSSPLSSAAVAGAESSEVIAAYKGQVAALRRELAKAKLTAASTGSQPGGVQETLLSVQQELKQLREKSNSTAAAMCEELAAAKAAAEKSSKAALALGDLQERLAQRAAVVVQADPEAAGRDPEAEADSSSSAAPSLLDGATSVWEKLLAEDTAEPLDGQGKAKQPLDEAAPISAGGSMLPLEVDLALPGDEEHISVDGVAEHKSVADGHREDDGDLVSALRTVVEPQLGSD